MLSRMSRENVQMNQLDSRVCEISPARLVQYRSKNTWNIIEGVIIRAKLMLAHGVAIYIFENLLGLFLHS